MSFNEVFFNESGITTPWKVMGVLSVIKLFLFFFVHEMVFCNYVASKKLFALVLGPFDPTKCSIGSLSLDFEQRSKKLGIILQTKRCGPVDMLQTTDQMTAGSADCRPNDRWHHRLRTNRQIALLRCRR